MPFKLLALGKYANTLTALMLIVNCQHTEIFQHPCGKIGVGPGRCQGPQGGQEGRMHAFRGGARTVQVFFRGRECAGARTQGACVFGSEVQLWTLQLLPTALKQATSSSESTP